MTKTRLLALMLLTALMAPVSSQAATPTPEGALERLEGASGGRIEVSVSATSGAVDMVRARRGRTLAAITTGSPEDRARLFLSQHGAVIGVRPADVASLRVAAVERDATTRLTHVRLDQMHGTLPVFGAQVVVHMSARGITGVNGVFVPGIRIGRARVSREQAGRAAVAWIAKHREGARAAVESVDEQVWVDGLVDGIRGDAMRAYAVEVEGAQVAEQVWVHAGTGEVIVSIPRRHQAKERCVYTPAYVNPTGNDELAVRKEGQPPTNAPPIDNLYDFTGQVYDLFSDTFGRDSFDDQGHRMRTIYDLTAICPNAYWDPRQKIARFCPGFDTDDIVAHEWGHAYTQATHDLIYLNQPGALNESYSDIWGEVIDLTNGMDGIGGSNNAEPAPNGQRWIVGEELGAVGAALGLRDMWDPDSRNMPGKVSAKTYVCGTGDQGGVHTNSSVPNHAFAMLVDGKSYNGHDIGAIGMTKASHIYYQAMVAYQTPTSGFAEHADALRASCADLFGIELNPIPGDPAGQAVTSNDCEQVERAIDATEMDDPPAQCGGPLLNPNDPGPCPGGSVLYTEDFEDGLTGWSLQSAGTDPARWVNSNWAATDDLPQDRAGTAAFADDASENGCSTATPRSPAGAFSMTSAPIEATDPNLSLRFAHAMSSDFEYDGGNVLISVNGGSFRTLSSYTFNAPNATLRTGSPKAGQRAWTGSDTGLLTGSWGTSVADLSEVVDQGDTFALRFEFAQDCADARQGWWVDDVQVLSCPSTPAPELSLGPDYEDPDTDGAYTLSWERAPHATGPDLLQEATVSAPLFSDDAESGLGKWVSSTEGEGAFDWRVSAKPLRGGSVFHAMGNEATTGTSSILTSKEQVVIPAAGQTTLTFLDWAFNHPGDKTVVEVSSDGSTWQQVYTRSTPYVTAAEAGLATEQMTQRSADLTPFAGDSVFLRFRFTQGPEIYIDVQRMGWYVDDIAVTNVFWGDVASVAGTSYQVTGRAPGSYMYRVRTSYGTLTSPYSEVVTAYVQ